MPRSSAAWSKCGERGSDERRSGGVSVPNWDDVPGRTAGDPTLEIDDLLGFGPEIISIATAAPGSYGFGAATFSASGPYTATIRVFVAGREAGVWQRVIDREFWEVGAIQVSADDPTHPCVEDFTDCDLDDDCPGF